MGGGGRPIYGETKECGPCLEPDSIKLTVKKEKKKIKTIGKFELWTLLE